MPDDQRLTPPQAKPPTAAPQPLAPSLLGEDPVLRVDIEHHDRLSGPLLLITLAGDLDLSTVALLRQQAGDAIATMATPASRAQATPPRPTPDGREPSGRHGAHQQGALVVDLSATDFIDSAGLGGLVAVWRLATASGCVCSLMGAQSHALRLLALTGVDRVIPHHAHLSDALAHDERPKGLHPAR